MMLWVHFRKGFGVETGLSSVSPSGILMIEIDELFVRDILSIRTIGDEDRNFFCPLREIDIASHEPFARFELHGSILLEHVRKRRLVNGVYVFFDLVRHLGRRF
jgi:hypothetical protein